MLLIHDGQHCARIHGTSVALLMGNGVHQCSRFTLHRRVSRLGNHVRRHHQGKSEQFVRCRVSVHETTCGQDWTHTRVYSAILHDQLWQWTICG